MPQPLFGAGIGIGFLHRLFDTIPIPAPEIWAFIAILL